MDLNIIEEKRIKICKRTKIFNTIAIICMVLFFALFLFNMANIFLQIVKIYYIMIALPIFFITSMVFFVVSQNSRKNYSKENRDEVLTYFMHEIYDEKALIIKDASISKDEAYYSDLINRKSTSFSGEDYFAGIYNGVKFKSSDLRASYTVSSGDHKRTVTLFNGLWLIFKITQEIKYPILISNEPSNIIEMDKGYKKIKMNNSDIDNYYFIYSTNEEYPLEFLDIDSLLNLANLFKDKRFMVSIKNDLLTVAVFDYDNHFELKLNEMLVNATKISLVNDLALPKFIIDILNLNSNTFNKTLYEYIDESSISFID